MAPRDAKRLPPNRFLAALARGDFARLESHLGTMPLRHGDILSEAGDPIRDIWFPHDAVVSIVAAMADGNVAECGTIGREGFVGFSAFLGGDAAIGRAVVQIPGEASRVPVAVMRTAWRESETFRRTVLLYVRALLIQLAQSVACNGLHDTEQRAARWLLMAHDRASRDTFSMTQEFLAEMLAVRRPTVSVIARRLQEAGLIRYLRGTLTITNRAGLEGAVCECYRIVRCALELDPDASTKSADM